MKTFDELHTLHLRRLEEGRQYLLRKQEEINTALANFDQTHAALLPVLDVFALHGIAATVSTYIYGVYIYASIDVSTFSDPSLVAIIEALETLLEREAFSSDRPADNYRSYTIRLPSVGTITLNANLLADGLCQRKLVRVEKREEERWVKVPCDVPIFEFHCPEGEPMPAMPAMLKEQAE